MRTYTVTEYDKQDYDDYENNVTLAEIINNLKFIKRGYIGDYNFTGEEDDFERLNCIFLFIKPSRYLKMKAR